MNGTIPPKDLDLNDLRLFAHVADQGGFAAAGRKLGLPRSYVSRRIARLEDQLGVRLIQRSTRSFSVTDLGREFHRQCLAMLAEAEAARELIEREHLEPQGVVRLSCPTALAHHQIGAMLARFLKTCPRVEIHMDCVNRRVDLLREGYDLAIRVRFPPLEDSDLIVRRFGSDQQHLLASPSLLEKDRAAHGPLRGPEDLARLPSLSWHVDRTRHHWDLVSAENGGAERRMAVAHRPRLATQEMSVIAEALLAGVGIAQLPSMAAREHLAAGRLVEVLPDWAPQSAVIHAVFPSRRGLAPSVRLLIDHLAEEYAKLRA